jgi:hypothetical protein
MPQSHRTGLHIFSLQRQDSAVAGKNFITMVNPVGSTKILTLGGFFVSYFATVAGPAYPMRGYRIGGHSGGTLAAASEVCKFDTAIPDAVAEIRYNNPTVTGMDGAFFNSPAGTVKDTVGGVHEVDAPGGFNPFILRPGEGVVLRQDAGAVGMLWNVSVLWREVGFV